jgi:hypothetical protein
MSIGATMGGGTGPIGAAAGSLGLGEAGLGPGGFYGGWEQASRGGGGYGTGGWESGPGPPGNRGGWGGSEDINAVLNAIPPTAIVNALLYGGSSIFGGKGVTFGDIAQGDPNPNFGTGVNGPDSGVGVGGGPDTVQQYPRQNNPDNRSLGFLPPPFQVNPMQVQNDMRPWGNYQQPQMNPYSMYGSQAPQGNQGSMYGNQMPFNWGDYLNRFGGK